MKFGHFDDATKEYVITSPATPLPWINYLGNESFFSLISNTCGGYCFYKDVKLLRLTRYRYNNVPADTNGRYYFIRHQGTVRIPLAWLICKTTSSLFLMGFATPAASIVSCIICFGYYQYLKRHRKWACWRKDKGSDF